MTCGRPWAEQHERQDRALTGLATAVLERAAAQLGERVLDIGCGAGTTVLALAVQVGPNGLCSGRRHFGAIRSSGARTHRHRRVTASRGDIRRCRTLQNAALARPRRRCPAWAVSSVAAGGAPLRAMRLATGFPEARGTPRAPPVPPASSPGAHLRRRRSDPRKTSHPGKNARLKLPAAKAWVLPAERHGAVRAALERFFQSHATQQGVAFLLWQGAARGRFLLKGAYCENGSSDLNQAERLRLPSITCCKAVMPMR